MLLLSGTEWEHSCVQRRDLDSSRPVFWALRAVRRHKCRRCTHERTPWAPQGGTPISFGFGGPEVGVDFTFGVPQSFTLIADSYVSYQFYPLIAGVPPYLAGTALDSSVFLDSRVGVYSYNQNALLQDATVIFGVPEPGSMILLAGGLCILSVLLQFQISRRRSQEERKRSGRAAGI